jgi:O-acetyl-ADP-ribose deacetylase (regulator of RNase III)
MYDDDPPVKTQSSVASLQNMETEKRLKSTNLPTPGDSSAKEDEYKPNNLIYKSGDITTATEDYIVHQCNCQSTTAAGLSAVITNKLPYAAPYTHRRPDPRRYNRCVADDEATPGTIQVWRPDTSAANSPAVIGLYAQYCPGKPAPEDSKTEREMWFRQCLGLIEKVPGVKSIAIPWQIGCGLAGGDWEVYEGIIREWAEAHPDINVVMYKLEESHPNYGGRGARRGRGRGGRRWGS